MKYIEGYEGLYSAEKTGFIYSHRKNGWLKGCPDYKGYLVLNLFKKGGWRKGMNCKVHRLIAKAFIPNPDNLPQINHKNGDKTDNRIENLEWCTNQQNRDHAVKMGLHYYMTAKDRKGSVHKKLSIAQ